VPLMRFGPGVGWVNIGARAGQDDTVDRIEQGTDIGYLRRSRKHQRQCARHVDDGAKVALSDHLDWETIFDAMRIPDHTDHGPSHRLNSAFIVLRKDLLG
jgi:hypothetical protein